MLIISKVFTILYLLCLCGNREYPDSFQNKAVNSSFKRVPTEVRGKTEAERFFWRLQKGGPHCEIIYPQEHLVVMRDEKVSPFVKFEIIPQPLLCFLSDPLTNKN